MVRQILAGPKARNRKQFLQAFKLVVVGRGDNLQSQDPARLTSALPRPIFSGYEREFDDSRSASSLPGDTGGPGDGLGIQRSTIRAGPGAGACV